VIKEPPSRKPVGVDAGGDKPDSLGRVRLHRRVAEIAACIEGNLGRAEDQELIIRMQMPLGELYRWLFSPT